MRFLTLLSIAILGIAGCSKDEQPVPGPTSSPVAGGQQPADDTSKKDIFRIYDEFIAAETIAKSCGASTPQLEEQHKKNFLIVTHAARKDLKEKYGKPESSLNDFLRGHDEMIRSRTLEMLKSHPCTSTDAKVVIHRYKLQSQWKI
jgi:CDP-diacylglycerol pyrophosphatase